jgi:O-acetyl-ADP-ribose deacetylase (regulator of RNase III)
MATSSQDVSRTDNVAWATAAALQAARMQNAIDPGSIRSVALPGLGASTGRVPPQSCAQQMRAAWQIVRDQPFDNFEEMHEALAAHLRDWTPLQVRRVRRKRILGIF